MVQFLASIARSSELGTPHKCTQSDPDKFVGTTNSSVGNVGTSAKMSKMECDICRLCGIKFEFEHLKYIFDEITNLAQIINETLPIKVSQDDHFKYICLDCYDKVINHYNFIQNILVYSKECETRTVSFFEVNKNEKLEDVVISKLHSDMIYPCPNCNKDLIILINNNPSDSNHTFHASLALVNQIEQSQENNQISDNAEEFNVCTSKSRTQDKLYELSLYHDIINENKTNDNKCDIKRKHGSLQKIDVSCKLKTGVKRKIQQSTSMKTFINPTKMQKLEAKLDTMERSFNELDSDYNKLNVTDLITFQSVNNDVECLGEEIKNKQESSTRDIIKKKYPSNLGKSRIIRVKLNAKEQDESNSNYDKSNITGLITLQSEKDNIEYITDDKGMEHNIMVVTKMEEEYVNENDTNDINISKNNVKQECNLCGARYILQEKYEFHMERHKLNKIDKYVCTKCDKETKNENLLWDHYLHMHKSSIQYLCLKCKKVFMKKAHLIAHQKTCKFSDNETMPNIKTDVDNQKIITRPRRKCKVCRKLIRDPNAINDEAMCASCKIRGISQRQYYCSKCHKHFMRQERLEFHKMRHNENMDEFICSTCGKEFSGENSLYEHYLFVHKGFRPHICEICGKSFQLKVRLKEHQRKHTGEMPYQCEVCGLRCRTTHALKFHKKSHVSNRHICEICGKSFLKKQNWNEHLERHWKKDKNVLLPRIFTCPVCNDNLPTYRMLKNHMIGIHELDRQDPLIMDQKPLYECNECQEKFKHQMSLKSHKEKVHEGKIVPLTFQCDICKNVYKAKRFLIRHIQSEHNDNKCQQCDETFTDKKDLDHHVSLHNSKKLFACEYSDKQRDARNLHHQEHTIIFYQCGDCNESFDSYANRLNHRKKMHKPE
ncbi:PREDICTED: zinc finger protein 568-like [Atta colombica]|uniref:zinc finger protein 568-like n=1 Tax=Atta colombica TaxID=520822 RepID=UPI00084BE519|nr:PREDICTED: zinc finger protein 568-like [Atta colombica]